MARSEVAAGNLKQARRDRSHEGIVASAARLLRERGLAGASVDEVMRAAGLTRGGFYSHFRDKNAMLVEGFRRAFDQSEAALFDEGLPARGTAWLEAAVRRYLSEKHVASTGTGCAVASVSGEVSRAEPELREAFAAQVERMLAQIEARLDGPDARARAVGLLATLVGGLVLARASTSDVQARAVLRACRAAALKVGA